MMQKPYSQKDIAEAIGVSKSTISRELERNCDKCSDKYVMDLAQRKADERKHNKRHNQIFTSKMCKRVKKLLKKGFRPEQITGRSRLLGIKMVSHETIYKWIWEDKHCGGELYKYLRRQGRKYAKRDSKNAGHGFIPNRIDIDERPQVVERKPRFGDLGTTKERFLQLTIEQQAESYQGKKPSR